MEIERESNLTALAKAVLEERYLLKDERGRLMETPEEMFWRVAEHVAMAEKQYGSDAREWAEKFFNIMADLEFLPNSPCLMNAGTKLGQLAACFVVPVPDSIEGIFTAVKKMAQIHKSGGGTGFSFSKLRPRGDAVASTAGVASGPVPFGRVFDRATQEVKQGGRRRGANMAILSYRHPDIRDFIRAKSEPGKLQNFNLSVSVDAGFFERAVAGQDYDLVNPRTCRPSGKANAKEVFEEIAQAAWETGDPGLVFLDLINEDNPIPQVGPIEATNPCGEQPLLPYESCVLGSICLPSHLADGKVDWEKLRYTVPLAVRFLDDCIDISRYPLRQIEAATKGNRKIGLGIMGLAHMLARMGIPYDSERALSEAGKVMKFISEEALEASRELAKERGSFPNFDKSIYGQRGEPPVRNATRTTVAPTGTISIIAGCSSGIEPIFASRLHPQGA